MTYLGLLQRNDDEEEDDRIHRLMGANTSFCHRTSFSSKSQIFPSPSKETDAISSVDDVAYTVQQEQEDILTQAADARLNLQSHIEEDLGLDFLPPVSQEQEEKLRHYESLLGSFDRLVGWEVRERD